MERLLNPERLVAVKRILRFPVNEITIETVPYWMALAIVAEAYQEENTQSLWVMELEDASRVR